jgi:hypothetical protein
MPSLRDISCPTNWINPVGATGKSCYFIPNGTFMWGDGLAFCQFFQPGASLIHARTSLEMHALTWIRNNILDMQPFWVSQN